MEPCVTCGNLEPVVPVSPCDCQCVTPGGGGQRDTHLIAPTRDTYTNWVEHNPIIPEGVFCLVKDRLFDGSLEYLIGDGTRTFTELISYAGAPLSRTGAENCSPLAALGKSTLDVSWLPVDSDGSGGLITNENGNLAVDFSLMPTDKFEALLKSLKMLIPIDRNYNFYVDQSSEAAADTIEDGRGTEAKPFLTIQACVNFVTSTYALGRRYITINVKAGTYAEALELPQYTRTSGYITIKSNSGDKDVIISPPTNDTGMRRSCVSATGGYWRLEHIVANYVASPTSSQGQPTAGCFVASEGAKLEIKGCSALQSVPDDPDALSDSRSFIIRMIWAASGATIEFEHDSVPTVIAMDKPVSAPFILTALHATRDASYILPSVVGSSATIECSGNCDTFLSLNGQSGVYPTGYGNIITFSGSTVTGKRYTLTNGSSVQINQSDTYFPGDTAGTVDDESYCYYA